MAWRLVFGTARTCRLATGLIGCCMALGVAGDAAAQTVVGRLLQSGSERPVAGAHVALLDSSGAGVATASDADGRFVLRASAPGSYRISAAAIGYEPAFRRIVDLGGGESVDITLFLVPRPVAIDSVPVSVKRRARHPYLDAQGFYDRRDNGFGTFIAPEDLEGAVLFSTNDIVANAAALRFVPRGVAGGTLVCARNTSEAPDVYMDGMLVSFADLGHTRGPDVDLDALVPLGVVLAVEVYAGAASVPLEFNATSAASCTILVWTRSER